MSEIPKHQSELSVLANKIRALDFASDDVFTKLDRMLIPVVAMAHTILAEGGAVKLHSPFGTETDIAVIEEIIDKHRAVFSNGQLYDIQARLTVIKSVFKPDASEKPDYTYT